AIGHPRTGRPLLYGIEDQLLIVATVTQQTPKVDSHWTHQALADYFHEPLGISVSQIGRILTSLDVKPHRVRGWLKPTRRPGVPHQGPGRVRALPAPAPRHRAVQCG
ncbi:MAG: hypothetical protein ACRDTA_26990, partial [Pseudonocardiaceae bacterium]